MKKIISYNGAAMLFALMSVLPAFSQELAVNSKVDMKRFSRSENNQRILYSNDVNGKVLRSFLRSFGEKPGVVWVKSEDGFIAFFKEDNRTTNVYFTCNGTIQYTIHYYAEDQLPKDVRHIVRSNFYDDSITHVSEVHKEDSVLFLVTVMSKTSIKTIRVTEGAWEVIEDVVRL